MQCCASEPLEEIQFSAIDCNDFPIKTHHLYQVTVRASGMSVTE